jgi:hypothetical protein
MCTPIIRATTACITGLTTSCAVCVGASGLLTGYTAGGGGSIMVVGGGTCSTLRCGITSFATASYSAVLGGFCNTSSGIYSTITGGRRITNSGIYSFIGGGFNNCICTPGGYSAIVGGQNATIACSLSTPFYSFIGAGYILSVSGSYSGIVTGINQFINNANQSFIGGGKFNQICSPACNSSISGGYANTICSVESFIGGGFCSTICCNAPGSGILGGTLNTVSHACSFVIGQGLASTATLQTRVNALSKASGTFEISHPDPAKNATKYLSHSFVESPTAGDNIYRYKVTTCNCQASLALPDYYKFLNENDQVWVSPVCHFGSAYGIVDPSQSCVNFTSNCDGDYNVLVIGTRKDVDAMNGWRGVETWK